MQRNAWFWLLGSLALACGGESRSIDKDQPHNGDPSVAGAGPGSTTGAVGAAGAAGAPNIDMVSGAAGSERGGGRGGAAGSPSGQAGEREACSAQPVAEIEDESPQDDCTGVALEVEAASDCSVELPPVYSVVQVVDWDAIHVDVAPSSGQIERIPRLTEEVECTESIHGGWYFDSLDDPKLVVLCPCSCAYLGASEPIVVAPCSGGPLVE